MLLFDGGVRFTLTVLAVRDLLLVSVSATTLLFLYLVSLSASDVGVLSRELQLDDLLLCLSGVLTGDFVFFVGLFPLFVNEDVSLE